MLSALAVMLVVVARAGNNDDDDGVCRDLQVRVADFDDARDFVAGRTSLQTPMSYMAFTQIARVPNPNGPGSMLHVIPSASSKLRLPLTASSDVCFDASPSGFPLTSIEFEARMPRASSLKVTLEMVASGPCRADRSSPTALSWTYTTEDDLLHRVRLEIDPARLPRYALAALVLQGFTATAQDHYIGDIVMRRSCAALTPLAASAQVDVLPQASTPDAQRDLHRVVIVAVIAAIVGSLLVVAAVLYYRRRASIERFRGQAALAIDERTRPERRATTALTSPGGGGGAHTV